MHLNVAAIVARGPASMHAARAATSTIPIVALSGTDPVAEGWAANLTRPGGNTTGLTVSFPALGTKRLEVLKQARPGLKRVAMMFEPAQITPTGRSDPLKAAASTLGLELQTLEVRDSADFLSPSSIMRDKVCAGAVRERHESNGDLRQRLGELARRHRLPSISEFPLMAEAGFLLSYGADLNALGRRAAIYIDKILKGARPGELPIERPTKFELVVNLETAKAIGLVLRAAILQHADRVIR